MPGPWEQYREGGPPSPAPAGPWDQYRKAAEPAPAAAEDDWLASAGDWFVRATAGGGGTPEQIREGNRRWASDALTNEGLLDRAYSLLGRGAARAEQGLLDVFAGVTGSREAAARAAALDEGLGVPVAGETSWQDLKANPSLGALGNFVLGTGVESAPSMATAAIPYVGLPTLAASMTGNVGRERAANNAREAPTGEDLLHAAPWAIGSAALERFGVKGILNPTGRTAVGRIGASAAREGLTEAGQSGLEYSGGTVGTLAGFDPLEAAEQMVAGGVAGGGIGGALRTGAEVARPLMPRSRNEDSSTESEEMWEGALDDLLRPNQPEGPWTEYQQAALPAPEPIAGLLPAPAPRQLPSPPVYGAADGAAAVGSEGLSELDRTAAQRRIEAGRPERPAPVENGGDVVRSIFGDQAQITSTRRGPNHPLTKANPRSWHSRSGAAVDMAPIPGMTFDQAKAAIRAQGYTLIEALDETGKGRSKHATGDHWHFVIGRRGDGAPIPGDMDAVDQVDIPMPEQDAEALKAEQPASEPDAPDESWRSEVAASSDPATGHPAASWVIRDRQTGEPVMETFDQHAAASLNTDRYEAVPVGQHLQELNDQGRTATPGETQDQAPPPARIAGARERRPEAAQGQSAAPASVSSAADLRGESLERGWRRFSPESGTLNIPRAEMPQIKAENRGAMVRFLNARGVAHEEAKVPSASLKPTQREFSEAKVQKAKEFEGGDRAILVSSDGYVLDGHHQWMAARDRGEEIRVIRLDAPIRELINTVREMPTATTADGGDIPAVSTAGDALSRALSELEARLDALGLADKVRLETVESLPSGSQGEFHPLQRLIKVALDAHEDGEFVLDHEAMHALRELGVFSEADWRRLVTAAKQRKALWQSIERRYREFDQDAREEEAVADLFAMWRSGRVEPGSAVRALFERLRNFLDVLRSALRGEGFRTWEDVLREVESGEAASREGQHPETRHAQFARRIGSSFGGGFSRRTSAPSRSEALEPVELTLEGWSGDGRSLAAMAREVYTRDLQGTAVPNRSLGADVAFTSEGKAEVFGNEGRRIRGRPHRAEIVRVLRDLVGNAVKVQERAPDARRQHDSRAFHTLVAPLVVNGEPFAAKIVVREALRSPDNPAHKFYDVATVEMKSSAGAKGTGDPGSPDAATFSVADLAAIFKVGDGVRHSRAEVEAGRPAANDDSAEGLAEKLVDTDGLKRDAEAVRRAVRDPFAVLRGVLKSGVADNTRALFYTADSRLRSLADRYGSRAINDLADQFHARAGIADAVTGEEFGAVGDTYHEAVQREGLGRANQALEILAPFSKDQAALERIANLLRQPEARHRTTRAEANAASKLAALLKDTIDYRRQAGEDIGEVVTGYFPRIMDAEKVLANRGAFLRKAEQLYRSIDAPNPRASAEGWLNHIFETYSGLDGGLDMVDLFHDKRPAGAGRSTAKERKFGAEADRLMAEFYFSDPAGALVTYFTGAAKKAEEARRFGDGKLQDMLDRVRRDIARSGEDPGDAMETIARIVGTQLGRVSIPGQRLRSTVGALHAMGMLGTLDRVTVTSLSEAMMGFVRAGPRYGLTMLAGSAREFARELKNAPPSDARRWAEALGVATPALFADAMMARSGIERASTGDRSNKVLQNFFRAVGLHQWTEGTRTAAVQTGRELLAQLAADMESRTPRVRRNAAAYLNELGVADPESFAAWLNEGGLPTLENLLRHDASPTEQAYRSALMRYVNQTIMKPTRAERPRWASHPVGGMFFSLMSYSYGFKKNVLDRTARLGARAIREKDPTLLYPAFGLAGLLVVHTAINSVLRPLVFGGGREEDEEGFDMVDLIEAADRAGLTGAASPLINTVWGVRYGRSLTESSAGAVIGRPLDAATKAVNLGTSRNSANTNTAERAAAEALYDVAIEPAMEAFGVTRLRGPARVASVWGTGSREGGVLPSDRAWFVDTVAGPKMTREERARERRLARARMTPEERLEERRAKMRRKLEAQK